MKNIYFSMQSGIICHYLNDENMPKSNNQVFIQKKKYRIMKKIITIYLLILIPLFVYSQYGGDGWSTIQVLNGEQSEEAFGFINKINATGDALIVGAPYNNSTTGYTKVFQSINGVWQQKGQKIIGLEQGAGSGKTVDINTSGNIIAVGDPWKSGGKVRAFKYNDTSSNWEQLGQTIKGTAGLGNVLSLSSDGSTIATNNRGDSIRVYKYVNNSWNQVGETINDNSPFENYFGLSDIKLTCDGNTIVIGAKQPYSGNTLTGYAKVYKLENNNWVLKGNAIQGSFLGGEFGQSVSISEDGNIVAISAPNVNTTGSGGNYTDKGHVYTYKYNEAQSTWEQFGQTFEGSTVGEYYGYSISLTPDAKYLAIGAYGANDWQGIAKVYEYNSSQNIWNQVGGDISGLQDSYVYFGVSVSISADGKILAGGAVPEGNTGNVYVFENAALLATNDIKSKSGVIYPNPTKDFIHIQNNKNIQSLQIYNAEGRLLMEANKQPLDLSGLNSGNYILKITYDNQQTDTKKIIKQ
ncbi:MAG: hypothetical protein DI529_12720 [Chryseobacterium sp.]|nr:MAG: hypothetical protein DI529_12720 [Chryseobacterium sp.]